MPKEDVLIYLNEVELSAEIEYGFTPEVPAKLYGLPENCYPAEPEEWDLHRLVLQNGEDISELIHYIEDDLIQQLRSAHEEHMDPS